MKRKIIKNIESNFDDVLFQVHIDEILSPIHGYHKFYDDTLYEFMKKAYDYGYSHAETLVGVRVEKIVNDKTAMKAKIDINNLQFSKNNFFGTIQSSESKLKNQTFRASEKTLSRVDNEINDILVEGYTEGVGTKEVSRRIQKKFGQLKGYESRRIARTEIHTAQIEGMIQGYDDLGVEYYQWNTHIDERTRSSHVDINGEIIKVGGTFSNGLAYPGDKNGPISEWVNCRCTPSPFIMPMDKIAPPGMARFREEDLITVPNTEFSHAFAQPKNYSNPLLKNKNVNILNSSDERIRILREIVDDGDDVKFINDKITAFEKRNINKTEEFLDVYMEDKSVLVKDVSSNSRYEVSIPWEMELNKHEKKLLSIHNHPSGVPIPSLGTGDDLMMFTKYNIKYNVIVSKVGNILIKNNEGKIYAESFYRDTLKNIYLNYKNMRKELDINVKSLKASYKKGEKSYEKVKEETSALEYEWHHKNKNNIMNMINNSFENVGFDIKLFII